MKLPHRRMPQRHAFDQNVLAAIRLNERWPQVTAFAEDTFADRRAVRDHFIELVPRGELIWIALLPAAARASFPCPPVLTTGIPVDDALTRARAGHLF